MVISGWGILLIVGSNQGITLTLATYPPFGLATLTGSGGRSISDVVGNL
jgi:hypothetical protein